MIDRALYAEQEGCRYKLWPLTYIPTIKDLRGEKKGRQVEVMEVKFHSLLYPDGTRWDSINEDCGKIDQQIADYLNRTLIPALEAENSHAST